MKKEKVVDLKPKADKISDKHLKELQDILNMTNNLQYNIGKLEGQKHSLLHELSIMQKRIIDMQDTLSKEYGTYDVDVTNGTINRKENDSMHYAVDQEVYGGHKICDIIEEEDKYSIYIRKEEVVIPWKDFNKNMAISVEYNLEY